MSHVYLKIVQLVIVDFSTSTPLQAYFSAYFLKDMRSPLYLKASPVCTTVESKSGLNIIRWGEAANMAPRLNYDDYPLSYYSVTCTGVFISLEVCIEFLSLYMYTSISTRQSHAKMQYTFPTKSHVFGVLENGVFRIYSRHMAPKKVAVKGTWNHVSLLLCEEHSFSFALLMKENERARSYLCTV